MAPFRWPKVEHDLALVKEYTESRPSKPDEWDEVAKRLSVVFQSEVKGRGCREHLDLLIKKHKAHEKKALKRGRVLRVGPAIGGRDNLSIRPCYQENICT